MTRTTDTTGPILEVGLRVHYTTQGATGCVAATITHPETPARERCDLVLFPPHPQGVTAEHDETRTAGTWHHMGHG